MSISKPPINPKTIFCYDKQLHLIIQSNFWRFSGKYVRVFDNNKMSKIVFFRNHSYFFSLEECQKYIAKKRDNFTIDRFPKLFETPKIKTFMSKKPTIPSKLTINDFKKRSKNVNYLQLKKFKLYVKKTHKTNQNN